MVKIKTFLYRRLIDFLSYMYPNIPKLRIEMEFADWVEHGQPSMAKRLRTEERFWQTINEEEDEADW